MASDKEMVLGLLRRQLEEERSEFAQDFFGDPYPSGWVERQESIAVLITAIHLLEKYDWVKR